VTSSTEPTRTNSADEGQRARDQQREASDASRYAALLEEAKTIRGISLWRDAWKRLRKNWAAMASLGVLIAIGLLALLTPILPLQSPRALDLTNRQYLPPNIEPATLALKREDVTRIEGEIAALQAQFQKASGDERTKLAAQLESKSREHPFNTLWTNPGFITRGLIHARLALFGNWCIPALCGNDELGRDVLSRICWGARVSLIVGIVATLVSLVIGVSYGATAGFLGGAIDAAMMRFVDILYSIPFIFVVIFLITILSEDTVKKYLEASGINRITIFYIVIGAIYWLTMARVVRGQIISLKHEQFVDAARTIGAGSGRIIFRHLVPNVMGIVIVYLTLTIPSVMLFEAFLSFLGLGVEPPDVSWGLLANEGIKVITPIRIYWWLVLFPGIALAMTLFALNFLGDGLRDALDPRMKNR
jgi:oligopeptide transport system permease protein